MLISDSHVPPKQVLCKSHLPPIYAPFWNGLGTDLERTYNGPETEVNGNLYRCVCLVTDTMLPLPLVEFLI